MTEVLVTMGRMAAPRKLPERDRLRVLLQSGMTIPEIARTYEVTRGAVDQMIYKEDLRQYVTAARASHKVMIPWRVKVAHNQDYPIRMLRLYARSLGLGVPLVEEGLVKKAAGGLLTPREGASLTASLDRQRQLELFVAELDRLNVVVDYDHEKGFSYVARQSDDRHYVRWPADVPDKRDEALAQIS